MTSCSGTCLATAVASRVGDEHRQHRLCRQCGERPLQQRQCNNGRAYQPRAYRGRHRGPFNVRQVDRMACHGTAMEREGTKVRKVAPQNSRATLPCSAAWLYPRVRCCTQQRWQQPAHGSPSKIRSQSFTAPRSPGRGVRSSMRAMPTPVALKEGKLKRAMRSAGSSQPLRERQVGSIFQWLACNNSLQGVRQGWCNARI